MGTPSHHPFRSEQTKAEYLTLYDERAKRWPADFELNYVDTAFGRTFVRISGPGDAPPLVLLPGASCNSLAWIPNIGGLSRSHRVYAVDSVFDFGRSVRTRPVRNGDEYAGWLDGFFDGLGLQRGINLMGMSLGGWGAAEYALRRPKRLCRLILLAPAALVLPLRMEFLLRLPLCSLHQRFTRDLMLWLLEDCFRKDDTTRAFIAAGIEDMVTAARCFRLDALPLPRVWPDEEWRRLRVPAMYLVGENEKIYSPSDAVRRLNAIVPSIRTEIIPGAGHDLPLVQAEMVNRKVLEFLSMPVA
jgi:pimeloyl-ACP methyl ester carboxylesterase